MSDLDKRVEAAEERWKAPEVGKKIAILEGIKALGTSQLHAFEMAEKPGLSESEKLGWKKRGEHLMACSNTLLDLSEEMG